MQENFKKLKRITCAQQCAIVAARRLNFTRANIQDADFYIFTSAHAAKRCARANMRCFSVGAATSKALLQKGAQIIAQSPDSHASGLCEILQNRAKSLSGARLIYVRAKEAAFDFEQFLRGLNLQAASVIAYENVPLAKPLVAKIAPLQNRTQSQHPKIATPQNRGSEQSLHASATPQNRATPKSLLIAASSPSLARSAYLNFCKSLRIFCATFAQPKTPLKPIKWHYARINALIICIGKSTQKTAQNLFTCTQICPQTSLKGLFFYAQSELEKRENLAR